VPIKIHPPWPRAFPRFARRSPRNRREKGDCCDFFFLFQPRNYYKLSLTFSNTFDFSFAILIITKHKRYLDVIYIYIYLIIF